MKKKLLNIPLFLLPLIETCLINLKLSLCGNLTQINEILDSASLQMEIMNLKLAFKLLLLLLLTIITVFMSNWV